LHSFLSRFSPASPLLLQFPGMGVVRPHLPGSGRQHGELVFSAVDEAG